jgi:heme/copper-type cytochrome/quinol oxidase subunit 1
VPQNNAIANALMEVAAITAIIGIFIWIIYAIVKYAKNFGRSLDDDVDEVEYLNKASEKEQYGIKPEKEREPADKNNIQYRKLYKKYARSKKYMTKNKLSGVKPDKEMMPDEITRKLITDDEEKSSIITKNYEKARYSDSEVSKEDIEFLKKL